MAVVWIVVIGFAIAFYLVLPGLVYSTLQREEESNEKGTPSSAAARWSLVGLIVVLGIGAAAYRLLVGHHLEQTSALFIGLPVLLSSLLVLLTRPKSATGIACKGMAIALLMSGVFLGEGFICIVMAAPLFFAVAVVIGGAVDLVRRRRRGQTTMTCLLLLGFVPMSLEGVHPRLSFPREQTVTVEQVVPRSVAEVERNLAAEPESGGRLPAYLRMGFPRPSASRGSGLRPGDERVVHFAGGEGKPGDLVLHVVEADESHVAFHMESDTSHVAHWLRWESAEVRWQPEGAGTRVQWTLRYRRLLDPAWYFAPWERYAVGLAGEYLIENVAAGQR